MEPNRTQIFINRVIDKNELKSLMGWIFASFGATKTALIADSLKDLGFSSATKAGISLSVEDLRVPPDKKRLLTMTHAEVTKAETKYIRGEITAVERFQRIVDTWNNFSETLKNEVVKYYEYTDPLNSIYMMAFSGARGNLSQVRQLVGMRGLMADPHGQIIDLPIVSNFREGLTVTEYLISSYGARKGLVDTSLRTADSGYLTRRLVDVAQDIIVRNMDCGTQTGIVLEDVKDQNRVIVSLKERLLGRTLLNNLYDDKNNLLVSCNQILDLNLAEKIISHGFSSIYVRSPLTCKASRSTCQQCYGSNLAYGRRVDIGEAIGIIAAQSIGEPGTQLTMRTFHTGGVFTGDFAKSIRAPFDGTVHYSKTNNKARPTRTRHGEEAFIIEVPTELIIQSAGLYYEKIALEIGMTVFVQEDDIVKKNEIIAEANTSSNLITEKASKDLILDISGEAYFSDVVVEEKVDRRNNTTKINQKRGIIWILSGELYHFPSSAKIKVFQNQEVDTADILATTTIVNENPGIVRLTSKSATNKIQEVEIITDSVLIDNAEITFDSVNNQYILGTNQGEQFMLKAAPSEKLSDSTVIAELISDYYETTTGGIIKYKSLTLKEGSKKGQGYDLLGEGTILWIPEETHEINRDISVLSVANGQYIAAGTEIMKETFAHNNGIVEILQSNDIVKELIIKPGKTHKIKSLDNPPSIKKHLYYPGEHIANEIVTDEITYVEYIQSLAGNYLLIRPVHEYHVPETKNLLKVSSSNDSDSKLIEIMTVQRTNFIDGEVVKSSRGVNLVSTQIILGVSSAISNITANIELLPQGISKNLFQLQLVISETLTVKNHFNSYATANRILVKDKQKIGAKTKISEVDILSNHAGRIILSQGRDLKSLNKLLIVTDKNTKTLSINSDAHKLKDGDLIKVGDTIAPNLIARESGQIMKVRKKDLKIRIGRPYLVSSGALLHVDHGEFVNRGDNLALLIYERVKTGDIVQGLPRIEEILEARRPKEPCKIAQFPGRVTLSHEDNYGMTVQIIAEEEDSIKYFLGFTQKLLVTEGEYVEAGQSLTDGAVNPHERLNILFEYYQTVYPIADATKISLQKVQLQLSREIQQVYRLQGVEIADKHVEVIVKQMTSKVMIEDAGDTNLLPSELIEIHQIDRINESMNLTNGRQATYYPILLGITKASLNTDSFISAASFQETTKILTEAAIEGKADRLKGLKENVIIGRLIPAGTGFDMYGNTVKEGKGTLKKEPYSSEISSYSVNSRNMNSINSENENPRTYETDH
uniref:DNA-directed RNA polymerase n=1 Tax=Gronococcus sybilensis TaxID=3028029 RepID=A0A9Y1I2M9_9RHOD|nr:RNA polymerase beta'' subunit [Gronococcus sybilensis]